VRNALRQFWLITGATFFVAVSLRAAENVPPLQKFVDDYNLQLTHSYTEDGTGDPAAFSFTQTPGHTSVYGADFALSMTPILASKDIHTTFEGHLGGANIDAEDSLYFKTDIQHDWGPWDLGSLKVQDLNGTFGIKYETDSSLSTRKLLVDIDALPTIYKWAIGMARPVDQNQTHWVQYRFAPYIGLEAGHTLSAGNSSETTDAIVRFRLRGRAQIFFPRVARLLSSQDLYIYIDDTFRRLLAGPSASFNIYSAGISWGLTKNVSIGFERNLGEDAPDFIRADTYAINLGVRLGASSGN
jgi:hypothetical protein